MNKHMKALIKKVEKQGGEVRITRRGHVQFKKDGRVVAVGAGTPSDPRSWANLSAQLRRAGFDV
ncbi:HicA-like toxin [Microbacterium phage Eden]|uniref:HicA-like toxin n=1 Tax=Microbacterium phage Eden TaxID=2250289 RepID=A0A345KWC0_9CAUD|nr:HicA-like toxin [Microbacterium phage Eden]AXH47322.1 HicA-like toxin [Microbacterium phage Eden]